MGGSLVKQVAPVGVVILNAYADGTFQMEATAPNGDRQYIIKLLEIAKRQVMKDEANDLAKRKMLQGNTGLIVQG